MSLTRSEIEADRQAHEGRVAILGVDLGRRATRFVLRALQAFGLYPPA